MIDSKAENLPFVTVSIPALNEAAYIGHALEALEKQSYPKNLYEVVVVVDSDTTDNTIEMCGSYNCRVMIDDQFHTIGGATALGYKNSTADIYAGTHADTAVDQDWIRIMVEKLSGGKKLGGIGGPLCARPNAHITAKLIYPFVNSVYRLLGVLFRRTYYAGPNYAYIREAYLSVGGHNPDLKAGEDNDLSIRVSLAGWELGYDRRMKVYTSERRLKEGLLRCIYQYGKLFVAINAGHRPKRFRHMR